MEFVPGRTLAEVLHEKKRLEAGEAVRIARQVLLALNAAADEHIVHRDIKPSNIMITTTDSVKVMDFGIAKLPSCASTTAGTILGTPYYMSPEQVSGQAVDIRSDLFSLGTVLYQMLGGVLPFEGESTATVTYKILHADPVPIEAINNRIPRPLAAILSKSLQKNPALRYQSPMEMLDDLNVVARPESLASYSETDTTAICAKKAPHPEEPPADTQPPHAPLEPANDTDEFGEDGGSRESKLLIPVPFEDAVVLELPRSINLHTPPKSRWFQTLRNWSAAHRLATIGLALMLVVAAAAAATLYGISLFGYRLVVPGDAWLRQVTGWAPGQPMTWSLGTPLLQTPRIEGHYRIDGMSPSGGRYSGTAVIGRTGNRYVVHWNIASQIFSGYGTVSGNTLTVTWWGTGTSGVVAYTLHSGGVLQSAWAEGKGTETLFPMP
jgi:hypothetical protein